MPKFGKASLERRALLCKDLRRLLDEVIKKYDFSIIESFRDKSVQERYYNNGSSKAHFGESAHNYNPSFAFDFAPWPCPKKQVNGVVQIDSDSPEWQIAVNIFKQTAKELNIDIICGADFKSFKDLMHIELADWRKRVKNI